MRILLCLNRDLMSHLALNLLWPALGGHVLEIVLSHGVGRKDVPRAPELEGWARLEAGIVEHGLYPLLDKGAGQFRSFEACGRDTESGSLHAFPSINTGEGLAYLEHFAPDIVVSIRFGQIFKAAAIAVPRHGVLNLHSGLLPQYRGVLATFWAMLEDAPEIGCTLHYVTDGTIDTGPVIGKHAIATKRDRSLLWNVSSLYEGGTAMIVNALKQLEVGQTPAAGPQDPALGRYFTTPDAPHIAQFLAKGHKLYSKADYAALFARYGIAPANIASPLTNLS